MAVLFVLLLLIFGAGLVGWAVHMHGVWTDDASRSFGQGATRTRAQSGPAPVVNELPARPGDANSKDARP